VEALDAARQRAWRRLAALVGALSAQKPAAGLRAAIGPHQAKAREAITGNGFSREKLDAAMAPIQGALDAALTLLQDGEKFRPARAMVNELEGYAGACGLRPAWSEELLDAQIALTVVNRYAGSPRWNALLEANERYGGWIDPGEAACIARLNAHRILIGLQPMEIDLRLVIAARKHSEEMVAKGYFAHDSPTADLKSPWQRAAREHTSSSGECIAGAGNGTGAFKSWYYSQGHHTIMIGGAPITDTYARQIGADGYAPDASSAARLALSYVQ
jgi:hypothetical protein